MHTIQLRNLPDRLYHSLVERARKDRRSVQQEALWLLEQALQIVPLPQFSDHVSDRLSGIASAAPIPSPQQRFLEWKAGQRVGRRPEFRLKAFEALKGLAPIDNLSAADARFFAEDPDILDGD